MELKNAKINFLGDSITAGAGTSAPEFVYHSVIKEKYGLEYAYNYGIGGTRIARQTVASEETSFDLTFELRAETMRRDADAVVVFGGTNDYGHGDAHFGNLDDEGIYTYCGAVNSLITKLKSDFPNAKIVFMTPLHRLGEDVPTEPDSKILADYVAAMKEICKSRGVAVIDLFGINPIDPTDAELLPDGLHPSDAGNAILAEVVANELMKL